MSGVSIVSTFEGGYQPNTAITAATALRLNGIDADLLDVYVDGLDVDRVRNADVVAYPIPLFDSLSATLGVLEEVRKANSTAKVVFFGQYATINAGQLASTYGDFAISGEWEQPIVSLARHILGENSSLPMPGIISNDEARSGRTIHPYMSRDHFRVPDRSLAPSLRKYPQPHLQALLGDSAVTGGIEATRGCHHRCSYCSVFAAYDGKVLLIDADLLVEDVRRLMADGMTHLTFTDADFFNARHHGVRVLRRLHGEFPHLTFDVTTRIDHILENEELLREASQLGLRIITSALEFPDDLVLRELYKEITVEMTERAITLLRDIGIRLNPTFITFNPWINLPDLVKFQDFLERTGLFEVTDPIQFETRLHLYKGSPLLANPSVQRLELTEREFHFDWQHADPAVDEVFRANITPAEEGVLKRCCLKC